MSLKILVIGSDRNLFKDDSAVTLRVTEYAGLVDELHIVVNSLKKLGLKKKQIAPNAWIYPTNSSTRWMYVFDASQIGKKIVFENHFVRGESVISAQDPFECGLAALFVKNKWRIPLEVQLHTNPFSPYFNGFLNQIRKVIAKKVLKETDSIRVVASYLKNMVEKLSSAPITVLPVFVDKKRIEEGKISFDVHGLFGWHFVILTVARLTSEKNVFLAIQILKKVREKYPNTGLAILGGGPLEDELKKYSKKLGQEGHVAFEGWKEDLVSYYKTSNIFLQTSYFEGNSLAIIEAGICGLPVVMTNVGIADELENRKEALIYRKEQSDEIAAGISDLIENNAMRQNLSFNMKQRLDKILPTKEEYLNKMKTNWKETALKIQ